jgi:hypothetical protein
LGESGVVHRGNFHLKASPVSLPEIVPLDAVNNRSFIEVSQQQFSRVYSYSAPWHSI